MRKTRTNQAVLILGLSLAFGASQAAADIFKYRDPGGGILLTDRQMSGGYTLLKTIRGLGGSSHRSSRSRSAGAYHAGALRVNRARYAPLIERVAKGQRLDSNLLHAVVLAESAYDPNAVSSAGATGLMQLMPDTARRFGVDDTWDPEANVTAGAKYLKELLGMFDNNLALALAAYNAGEGAVQQYGNKIPPFQETQEYVRRVLDYYRSSRPTAYRAALARTTSTD
jgi:hypothetical protein